MEKQDTWSIKKTFAKCLTNVSCLVSFSCELIDSHLRLEIQMEFKFVLRRVIAGIITLPVALLGYFLLYAFLDVFVSTAPVGSWQEPVANFPAISFAWIVGWAVLPLLFRLADKD
jgi:hypothetical protein